jgi:hypothetical protein
LFISKEKYNHVLGFISNGLEPNLQFEDLKLNF